jgi:predicted nuclease with TOPRIM domain
MWDWAIWAALILVTVAVIAAFTLLVLRSLKAWRAVRDTGGEILRGLDDFTAKAEEVAEKIATADNDTAEVQESLGRLRVSLARLAVLRAAIDDVDRTFGGVAAAVPRK